MSQQKNILDAIEGDDVLSLARIGVDPQWARDWSDCNKRGLLHHAIHSQAPTALEWMIDQWGLDTNTIDNQGETPLMRASWLGDIQSVEVLLNAGADIDAMAHTGGTALHYAYAGGKPAAVAALGGADNAALDRHGRRPLDWKPQGKVIDQGAGLLKRVATEPKKVLRLRPRT